MKRRKFIKNTFWTCAGLGLLGGYYSLQIEPFDLEFVRLKMPIKNLPKDLVGKTLMQISDIHVGHRFDYHYIIDSFKKAQIFNPDLVVYTGDYVSSRQNQVPFSKLEETLSYAVKGTLATIAILGNHDYGQNWQEHEVADKISETLTNSGIQVLRNETQNIQGLNIIGIDEYWGTNFDPKKALSKFEPNQANIVLCHNPDVCDENVWGSYNSWILCGHTHGGQAKPPFLPPPILPVKNKNYSAGKISLSNNRTLYINRALGHLWQIRFNVRPEITIFELVHA